MISNSVYHEMITAELENNDCKQVLLEALRPTITYNKQPCTNVFIMRWILQNYKSMTAPYGSYHVATLRYHFKQGLLTCVYHGMRTIQ